MSTLTEYPKIFDPEAAPDEAAKAKSMKSMFLARWQLKGRTPQMLYMEWQNLKFDPTKDDIEDFCNDIKNLANRLGYPEDAQVMTIKATLPPLLVTQVINVKTFKEIRDTLITLVENPVIKRVLLTEGTGEKGLMLFSMSQMQWQPENDVGMCDPDARPVQEEGVWQTPKSLGKIINKIDSLELKCAKWVLLMIKVEKLHTNLKWPLLDLEEELDSGEQVETPSQSYLIVIEDPLDLGEIMEGHKTIYRVIIQEVDMVTEVDLREMGQVLEVEVDLTKAQI